MEDAQLVLVAAPGMGHLIPEVELCRRLVDRNPRLSVTVLVPRLPFPNAKVDSYLHALNSDPSVKTRRITLLELTSPVNPPEVKSDGFFTQAIGAHKPAVKRAVQERTGPTHPRLAGFLLDVFCAAFADVAKELGVPSYLFFTSGAAFLRLLLHFDSLGIDVPEVYGGLPPETAVEVPGFRNPVPIKVWPGMLLDRDKGNRFLRHVARFHKAEGILVNSFRDLESDLIDSLSVINGGPPIYPVGPILDVDGPHQPNTGDPIFDWLDAQPPCSVVFLCFGSRVEFGSRQVAEIAAALERSGHRFLWSLQPQPEEILPDGFVDRTARIGRVIGWAPQVAVLGHRAVGAFVSHCGWNSVVESVWFGVPVAVWPVSAEQHLNAFVLLEEIGVAVEVRIDCKHEGKSAEEDAVVGAAEVEAAIRRIMDEKGGAAVRRKVREVSVKAREALVEGGSSYESLGRFAEGILKDVC